MSSDFQPGMEPTGNRPLLYYVKKPTESHLRIPPGNRLERLSGARKGQYSIRINDRRSASIEAVMMRNLTTGIVHPSASRGNSGIPRLR